MSTGLPRHALSFMAATARLAAKHGLKAGIARAAAQANPATMVLEAVTSFAGAVDS